MKYKDNGLYPLSISVVGQGGDKSVLYVSGDLGTAVVNLVYVNGYGNNIPIVDSTLEMGKQYIAYIGTGIPIYIEVMSANGLTDFEILVGSLG